MPSTENTGGHDYGRSDLESGRRMIENVQVTGYDLSSTPDDIRDRAFAIVHPQTSDTRIKGLIMSASTALLVVEAWPDGDTSKPAAVFNESPDDVLNFYHRRLSIVPPLTLNTYQSRTADTAIYPGKGTPLGLIYCGLKLAGEAGEVAEKIGKAIRDDGMMVPLELVVGETWRGKEIGVPETMIRMKDGVHPDRREALKGELGDVLWYVASAARELGYDLADIAQSNLDKLADRAARGTLQGSGDNR